MRPITTINAALLKKAIDMSPFNNSQVATYAGKSAGYLTKVFDSGRIDDAALDKICQLLNMNKSAYIAEATPEEPQIATGGGTDLAKLIDVLERIDAKLAMIRNDGIAQTNLINAKFNKILDELEVHRDEV